MGRGADETPANALTYGATRAAAMLGISRSSVYARATEPDKDGVCWLVPGQVRILRVGQRVLVPRRELDALFAEPANDLSVSFT